MKFIIRRTSIWKDDKPCDEAYEGTYTRMDIRYVKSLDKVKHLADTWYTEGVNHRKGKGCFIREFPDTPAWFVDIDTIEQLTAFMDAYGELVLTWHFNNQDIRVLEIYDTYRE